MKTIIETVSASEIETRTAAGWTLIQENIIAGKVRSAVMSKEGNATAWLTEHATVNAAARNNLTKTQRRIANHRDYLRHRGWDL